MTETWNLFDAGLREPRPGEVRVYDRIDPAVLPGTYRLEASTNVTAVSTGTVEPQRLAGLIGYGESLATWLEVVGPHARLEPTAFQKIVPLGGSRDVPPDDLPHVVLRRATLPWERDPRRDPAAGDPRPPWLAVVVLTDAERATCAEVALDSTAARTAGIPVETGDPPTVDVLGVPGDLLAKVFPRRADVPVLCHGREANPADADLAAGDDDGFFAVVLANRRPPASTACTAYLLSLDGRWNALDRPAPTPATGTTAELAVLEQPTVRAVAEAPLANAGGWTPPGASGLGAVTTTAAVGAAPPRTALDPVNDTAFCVLAKWSFETGTGGDFRSIAGALDLGFAGTQPAGEERTVTVTPTGHVRLQATTRAGDPYLAWYRGPLIARRSPAVTRTTPVHHADALRPDATGGPVDITQAAAFEIGRLLAVADTQFLVELRRWAAAGFAFDAWFHVDVWFPAILGREELLRNLPYRVPGLPVTRGEGPLGVLGPRVPSVTPPVVPGIGGLDPIRDPGLDDVLPALGGLGLDAATVRGVLDGTFVGSTHPGVSTGTGPGFGDVIGIAVDGRSGIISRFDDARLQVTRLGQGAASLDTNTFGGMVDDWQHTNPTEGGQRRPGEWPP